MTRQAKRAARCDLFDPRKLIHRTRSNKRSVWRNLAGIRRNAAERSSAEPAVSCTVGAKHINKARETRRTHKAAIAREANIGHVVTARERRAPTIFKRCRIDNKQSRRLDTDGKQRSIRRDIERTNVRTEITLDEHGAVLDARHAQRLAVVGPRDACTVRRKRDRRKEILRFRAFPKDATVIE